MNIIQNMINHLSEHPQIGVISGFSSGGLMLTIQTFLTDENTLKIIAACGVWLGFMIAIMTAFIKLFELFRILRKKFLK